MDSAVIYLTLLIKVMKMINMISELLNVSMILYIFLCIFDKIVPKCTNFRNICKFYTNSILGNKAGTSRLLQQGLNVDETDKNNYTPLIYAARKGIKWRNNLLNILNQVKLDKCCFILFRTKGNGRFFTSARSQRKSFSKRWQYGTNLGSSWW